MPCTHLQKVKLNISTFSFLYTRDIFFFVWKFVHDYYYYILHIVEFLIIVMKHNAEFIFLIKNSAFNSNASEILLFFTRAMHFLSYYYSVLYMHI